MPLSLSATGSIPGAAFAFGSGPPAPCANHLVRGFTVNERQLAERGLREARETLDLLSRTLLNQALVDDTGQAVLELIGSYADTWRLLLEYDEDRLRTPLGAKPSTSALDHDRVVDAIAEFKRELMARGEASPLFGNPRGDALAAILGNIEQTMFGEPLYRSREEKAAHLLYFIVKDHPFTDGNKRIGSLLFLLYLNQEGVTHRLNPQALTALTLLIRRERVEWQGPDGPARRQPSGGIGGMNTVDGSTTRAGCVRLPSRGGCRCELGTTRRTSVSLRPT